MTKWKGPLGSELLTVIVVGIGLCWVVAFTLGYFLGDPPVETLYIALAFIPAFFLMIAPDLVRSAPVWRCVYSMHRDPEALSKVELALEGSYTGRTSRILRFPTRERVVLDVDPGQVIVDRFVDRAIVYVGPAGDATRTQVERLKMSVERALE